MKVGDRVRKIAHKDPIDAEFMNIGDEGVILEIDPNDSYYKEPTAHIKFDTDNTNWDEKLWFAPLSDLSLVEEARED